MYTFIHDSLNISKTITYLGKNSNVVKMEKTMYRSERMEIDVPKDYRAKIEKVTTMIKKYNGRDLYNGTDLIGVLRMDVLCSLATIGYGPVAERNEAVPEHRLDADEDNGEPLFVVTPDKIALGVSEGLMSYIRKYKETDLDKCVLEALIRAAQSEMNYIRSG